MTLTKQIVATDFMQLKGLAKIGNIYTHSFGKYDSVYPFTNDDLKAIYKKLDSSGGVVTVTASLDHALMAVLNDAPYIKMFDINHLAKYFAYFKLIAIISLDYDEFLKLYKINIPFSNYAAGGFLNEINVDLYYKVLSNMNPILKYFFELFYDFFITATNREKCNIINNKYYPKLSGYLNRKDYEILKQKLKSIKSIEFIDCNIFELKKHLGNEKYSAMVFSNISTYFNDKELNDYLLLLKQLEKNLTENGLIQAGYGNIRSAFNPGKNRMNPKFVDSHKNCFFETKSHGKIITYYKPNSSIII